MTKEKFFVNLEKIVVVNAHVIPLYRIRWQHVGPYYIQLDMTDVLVRRTRAELKLYSLSAKPSLSRCLKETGIYGYSKSVNDKFNKMYVKEISLDCRRNWGSKSMQGGNWEIIGLTISMSRSIWINKYFDTTKLHCFGGENMFSRTECVYRSYLIYKESE